MSGKGYPLGGWCLATVRRPKAGGEEPACDDAEVGVCTRNGVAKCSVVGGLLDADDGGLLLRWMLTTDGLSVGLTVLLLLGLA